jgi:hypothetical protein
VSANFNLGLAARAAVTRADHGDRPTQAVAAERMRGFAKGLTKDEVCQVLGVVAAAYLRASE